MQTRGAKLPNFKLHLKIRPTKEEQSAIAKNSLRESIGYDRQPLKRMRCKYLVHAIIVSVEVTNKDAFRRHFNWSEVSSPGVQHCGPEQTNSWAQQHPSWRWTHSEWDGFASTRFVWSAPANTQNSSTIGSQKVDVCRYSSVSCADHGLRAFGSLYDGRWDRWHFVHAAELCHSQNILVPNNSHNHSIVPTRGERKAGMFWAVWTKTLSRMTYLVVVSQTQK